MECKNQVRKLQLLELKIAEEIKRICEKNNIKYFLMWGSLLGAVRHGGFIPWDDDMDFGMLREDYDRFIEVCKTDLDKRFFIQTWDTDPEYPFAYAKIRLVETHFIENFSQSSKMNNGIFVDVFPFDNVPHSAFAKCVQGIKYYACTRILWIKKGMGKSMQNESFIKRMKYNVFLLVSKPFPYKIVKKRFKQIQIRYNKTKEENIVPAWNAYRKMIIRREWAENLEHIQFETTKFPAFKKKEDFLTYTYGDYMTPPPIEKRNGHEAVFVDFGPYN